VGIPPHVYRSELKVCEAANPEMLLGVNADLIELSMVVGGYVGAAINAGTGSDLLERWSDSDCELNIWSIA
jgi:hypothetical protein